MRKIYSKPKYSTGENIFNVFNIILMIFLMAITAYPLLFSLFASVSDSQELARNFGSMLFWPLGFSLDAYRAVLTFPLMRTGYMNTLFLITVGVALNILFTAVGAYFLSRKNLMWKNVVLVMVLITMFFGGGLIPRYLNIMNLGLLNSIWVLILPGLVSTFNLLIMRTAYAGIPDSLSESAEIDGAGHLTVLFKILTPLAMPTIAVLILFYGVGHWNAWFDAMIFVDQRQGWPLQMVLREVVINNQTNDILMSDDLTQDVSESIRYATMMVATIPILVLYPFLQRFFVKGVMIGAVKG